MAKAVRTEIFRGQARLLPFDALTLEDSDRLSAGACKLLLAMHIAGVKATAGYSGRSLRRLRRELVDAGVLQVDDPDYTGGDLEELVSC